MTNFRYTQGWDDGRNVRIDKLRSALICTELLRAHAGQHTTKAVDIALVPSGLAQRSETCVPPSGLAVNSTV
jgi:hypothetical protein